MESMDYKINVEFLNFAKTKQVYRFSLESKQDGSNFALLEQKVKKLSSDLKEQEFNLQWTDKDGDDIIINNEEGWNIAIKELKSDSGPIKLKVLVNNKVNVDLATLKLLEEANGDQKKFETLAQKAHEAAHKQAVGGNKAGEGEEGVNVVNGPTVVKTASVTATVTDGKLTNFDVKTDEKEVGHDEVDEEDSLEEMFNQISSHGADYLRQLGSMISNALETIDNYVAEGEEGEERRMNEEKEKKDEEFQAKIKKSLDSLIEMGYDDENGWLTHLLQSKSGDVDEVLATLKPEEKKKHQD